MKFTADVFRGPLTGAAVLIGIPSVFLTRFLHANRYLLRWKTL